MKIFALALPSLAMVACATTSDIASNGSVMACDVGPLLKSYGRTEWLVYSCKDGRSVVVVAAPGNPAMPFFFMLSPEDDGIRLYGEGNGNKSATKAAFDELELLTELDVAKLVLESKEHAP